MIRMKTFTAAAFLAALVLLFLLCSCTSHSGSSAAVSAESSSKTPVVSKTADMSMYDRATLIEQNLQCDAMTENPGMEWVVMLLEKQYQAYTLTDITPKLEHKEYAAKDLVADKKIALLSYSVRFRSAANLPEKSLDDEGWYTARTQIIALVSDDDKTLTLSGMEYRDYIEIYDLVEYLAQDNRCTLKTEVVPVVSDGVKIDNLPNLLPGFYHTAIAAGKNLVAYIRRDGGTDDSPICSLVLRNIATGKDVFSKSYTNYSSNLTFVNGCIEFRYRNKTDTVTIDIYKPDGKLVSQTEETRTQKTYLPESNICILQEEGSIYRLDEQTGEKILLLKGTPSDDTDVVYFHISNAIDDHRFIFVKGGWEWTYYTGVYDLSAMSETKISTKIPEIFPIAIGNGKIYLYNYGDDYDPEKLWMIEQNQIGTEPVLLAEVSDGFAFSPDMRYVVYTSSEDRNKFIVYDLITQSKKAEFCAQYMNVWERFQFADNNTFVAFSQGVWGYDDYMITYEIK